jgi:hypothetical protein
MPVFPPALALALAALFTLRMDAALAWEKNRVELRVKSIDSAGTAVFNFKNEGTTPVTISRIQPDCGCVTVAADKPSYQPGEPGQIAATFIIGKQAGERTVPIQVSSDADSGGATVLILHVTIVPVVVFSEPFLYWKDEDPLESKTVTITLSAGEALTLKEVRSSNPEFRLRLQPTSDPLRYKLEVAPPFDRRRAFSTISAITTSPGQLPQEHSMIARVL